MGALQAQDYAAAEWAVGLRCSKCSRASVQKALDTGQIIRTWPMRGTLHFVAAQDARWMTALLAPRAMTSSSHRWKVLRLTDKDVESARKAWSKALAKSLRLDRDAMFKVLDDAGVSPEGQRGAHLLRLLSQYGLICGAGRLDKKPAFALLERWAPQAKDLPREQALAEICLRYFNSHGPATLADFQTWSGLSGKESKIGLEAVTTRLVSEVVEGKIYWMSRNLKPRPMKGPFVRLLPAFDEYLLGYQDRSAVLEKRHADRVCPGGNGMFLPMVVADGKVTGTWRRNPRKTGLCVIPELFKPMAKAYKIALEKAAEEWCGFNS
jgi:hypothetical protein